MQPVVKSRDLEKPDLTVGYVPVNDCAPFAIAWKKGFFRKYGLNVTLNREASWANSRDGLIFGRLEKATSGSVRLDGKEIRKPGAERMMVFQNYALLPWLTVRENIRLAVDEVLKNANRSEKISIVNEHLSMVNLTAAADKYPDELSGGMKQRVGIARALAIRPKMLLMDEPFGALDALTRGKLQRQVLDIWENHRQAVMMITHDVDEAIYMSDRIVLMTNGPAANIGKILEVPFEHPRDRAAMRNSKEYFELRNHALNFLDRYFTQDE
ncbi:MAG: nitrate ABC transporter ATP-binding protein [Desmonostoc geniculatum HA4340-LM1]|nr:nitrate ABC transporter ATP-binding protein [Desmonostoc geniculatum HA4340-LM1]